MIALSISLTILWALTFYLINKWIDLHKPIKVDLTADLIKRVDELQDKISKLEIANGFRQ